jgi:hypothetical protein
LLYTAYIRRNTMRKQEKEIRDTTIIHDILRKAPVCRLGLSRNNRPYVVPMNYCFDGGSFYFHSASVGEKIEHLKENNAVCIEVDIPGQIVSAEKPCSIGFSYRSVIAFGTASFVDDPREKVDILTKITKKYTGKEYTFSENEAESTAIIRVVPETLTGKQE